MALTKSGLKLGFALPQGFPDGTVDLSLVREVAIRAEVIGFDDLWVMEQITGSLATLEPVTLLAYVAAVTSRVRLGASVLVTNLHNPIQLAKALSSVDHISGGRLTVGVGLGTNTRMYPAFGLPEERRVGRFVDGLRVMKALWTQPLATVDTPFWQIEGVLMEPKPLQKPHPPLWFGARTEAAMVRAVRLGDGWMGAGSTDLTEAVGDIARMREILRREGRDEATFPLSKRVYIAVDENEERARQGMRTWLGGFYGNPDVADRWAVAGSASRCLDALLQLRDAGLQHILVHPVYDSLQQLEIIAEKLAPQL